MAGRLADRLPSQHLGSRRPAGGRFHFRCVLIFSSVLIIFWSDSAPEVFLKVGVCREGFLLVPHESQSKVGIERYRCSKLVPESHFTSSTLSQIFQFFNFWSSNFLLGFCVAIYTLEPLQTYFNGCSALYSVPGGARFSMHPNATLFWNFLLIFHPFLSLTLQT